MGHAKNAGQTGTVATGTPRISIAGVSERDMDLLLLEEFESSKSFRLWFATQVLGKGVQLKRFIGAKRSVTQLTGESDLEVSFADAKNGSVSILIENKVSAGFQPQQAKRYRERGEGYIARQECAVYRTVLVAPDRYIGKSKSTKGFDSTITYEALADWFQNASGLGERRKYKLTLINSAINKGTPYQPDEDKLVTEFWKAYWLYAREVAPELEMEEPGSKASGAGFIYFRPPILPRGVVEVCHKFWDAYVDLQLRGLGGRLGELHHLVGRHLPNGAELKRAAQSAAIRLRVPRLDSSRPFGDQASDARTGLGAAQDLLRWYLQDGSRLLSDVLKTGRQGGSAK